MAKQSADHEDLNLLLCQGCTWLMACLEIYLMPICLDASAVVGRVPLKAVALLVAIDLPLAACACLSSLYVPAMMLILLVSLTSIAGCLCTLPYVLPPSEGPEQCVRVRCAGAPPKR